ncbi:MAG: hypothetical protein BEN18_09855 [Epulopiscium sp. Nuni2H_MBin001]|nr:MAG: hypothetical protein BEN18_09855 [Epulopiscium sp. Nuni2H_MBin001]
MTFKEEKYITEIVRLIRAHKYEEAMELATYAAHRFPENSSFEKQIHVIELINKYKPILSVQEHNLEQERINYE